MLDDEAHTCLDDPLGLTDSGSAIPENREFKKRNSVFSVKDCIVTSFDYL